MTISNLSAAANETIRACGKTAVTLIDATRAGGSLALNRVDTGWSNVVHTRASRLNDKLRQDLVAAQREVSGYYARGLEAVTGRTASAVQAVVNAASARVEKVSNRIERFEQALGPTPLASAIVIAQPFAEVGRELAGFVAERTAQAVARIERDAPEVKVAAAKRAPVRAKASRRG